MSKFENFEKAFDSHFGSCLRMCECGREFYNPDTSWDFGEAELERLEKDPNTVALDWAVPLIHFEGCEYVTDCDCWKDRANKIMGFIDSHAQEIAQYLNLEKQRKLKEAEKMPEVPEVE